MPTNDFIGFASSGSANIASQADYAAAAEHGIGMQPGPASSKLANKAWRQGANMAAVIGELIKNHGNDALDNGDLVTLYNALLLSTASTTLAGLMSAADKTRLDNTIIRSSPSNVSWTLNPDNASGNMAAIKVNGLLVLRFVMQVKGNATTQAQFTDYKVGQLSNVDIPTAVNFVMPRQNDGLSVTFNVGSDGSLNVLQKQVVAAGSYFWGGAVVPINE